MQVKVTSAVCMAKRVSVSYGTGSWQASDSLHTSNRQARAAILQVTDTSLQAVGLSGKGVSGKVAG